MNVKDEITNMAVPDSAKEEIAIERAKWANRRKMAWIALYTQVVFLLAFVLLALLAPITFTLLLTGTSLLTWVLGYLASVLIAYFGGTVTSTIMQSMSKTKT